MHTGCEQSIKVWSLIKGDTVMTEPLIQTTSQAKRFPQVSLIVDVTNMIHASANAPTKPYTVLTRLVDATNRLLFRHCDS